MPPYIAGSPLLLLRVKHGQELKKIKRFFEQKMLVVKLMRGVIHFKEFPFLKKIFKKMFKVIKTRTFQHEKCLDQCNLTEKIVKSYDISTCPDSQCEKISQISQFLTE